MVKGSINSFETFGLVDGPGIRTVIFLNGCQLRCKYCHNPEMWRLQEDNYTPAEVVEKCKKNNRVCSAFSTCYGNRSGDRTDSDRGTWEDIYGQCSCSL